MVTGAGSGIGYAITRRLLEAGYAVSAWDVAEGKLAGANDAGLDFHEIDVRDKAAMDRVVAGIQTPIVGLVNCAAIYAPLPLEEVTADEVRKYFEVNTLGTFVCCQHAGLKMAAQESGGVIVNIGDWAIARPYAGYAAYFPSKGAIPALTRMFAVELSQRNPQVRVNAILPGPVIFPRDMPEAEREAVIAATLVKRAGTPQNIAQAVLFFVENDFVTGVCLPVDGGRTLG